MLQSSTVLKRESGHSGSRTVLPTLLIYPRVMIKAELLDKVPVGIIGVANKSGWINEMIFVQMTTSLQMSLATEQFCFYNSNLKCALWTD